jgi:hypothetical protein
VRQQRGYGEAEALLERKWPDKYNALGHVAWAGQLYGGGVAALLSRRSRIYHGTWGMAPFQSVYRQTVRGLGAFALTPEWYLFLLALALFSVLGVTWTPLALTLPLAVAGALLSGARAVRGALDATFRDVPRARRWRLRVITAWLHLLQPFARLRGRLDGGLTPWRRRGPRTLAWPSTRTWTLWAERRREAHEWVGVVRETLLRHGYAITPASAWDSWDLHLRGGALGGVRLLMASEEHGRGRQLVRLRTWPRATRAAWLAGGFAAGAVLAGAAGAAGAEGVLLVCVGVVAVRGVTDCAIATAAVRDVFAQAAWAELEAARVPTPPAMTKPAATADAVRAGEQAA